MRYVAIAVLLIFTISGCGFVQKAVNSAVEQTVESAATSTGKTVGSSVGSRFGEHLGQSIVGALTPQLVALYCTTALGYAFNTGSYWVAEDYQAGEWTRWNIATQHRETVNTLEKAYLKQLEDGSEWWKIKLVDPDEGTIIMEALFSAEKTSLLRLRAKFPGQEAGEVPVQEGTFVYAQPVQLSEESLEGATVGLERVNVPAGSFEARHVRYLDVARGNVEWYLSDQAPGGIVKYQATGASVQAEDGAEASVPEQHVVELAAYGSGAQTELGSY